MTDLGFCTIEYDEENNIQVIEYSQDHFITGENCKKVVPEIKKNLTPGKKTNLLVVFNNSRLSKEASEFFNLDENSKFISKIAFLVDSNTSKLVLSIVFFLISGRYQHDIFNDRESAIAWLKDKFEKKSPQSIQSILFEKSTLLDDLVSTFKKGTRNIIILLTFIGLFQLVVNHNILLSLYCFLLSGFLLFLYKKSKPLNIEYVLNSYILTILFFTSSFVLGTGGYKSPYICLLALAPVVVTTLTTAKYSLFWLIVSPTTLAIMAVIGSYIEPFEIFRPYNEPHLESLLIPLTISFTNGYRLMRIRKSQDDQYKKIHSSQKLLKQIFSGMTDMVFLIDTHWNIAYVNEETTKKLGYSIKDLIGKNFNTIISDTNFNPEAIEQVNRRTFEAESVLIDNNFQKIPALLKISETTIDHANQLYWIVMAIDISEQKKQEAFMINTERFSLMGQMASGIAHEINNPLTVITIKAEQINKQLNSQTPDIEKVKKHISDIDNTVERISKVISGLKKLSRDAERDPFIIYKASSLIEESLFISSEKAKNAGIQIKVDMPQNLELECRPVQIVQILLNLINNSIDSLEFIDAPKWILLSAEETKDEILFRCSDSGPGIPRAQAEKLFSPFFTTKDIGKGSGIGLMISLKIAQAHGGTILIERNEPNPCFLLKLPKCHMPSI